MKATITPRPDKVSLHFSQSGADVLREVTKYSKTIGNAVAAKLALTGDAATKKAKQIQRTLRRVRLALEAASYRE